MSVVTYYGYLWELPYSYDFARNLRVLVYNRLNNSSNFPDIKAKVVIQNGIIFFAIGVGWKTRMCQTTSIDSDVVNTLSRYYDDSLERLYLVVCDYLASQNIKNSIASVGVHSIVEMSY